MDAHTSIAHGVAPLVAERLERLELPVPEALQQRRRIAQLVPLVVQPVLERARNAYDGRMLILKGPEIAACYRPGTRFYGDLDVLVDDAPAALEALLAAGFATMDERIERRPHHLPPVWWPGFYLPIEIHSRLNWPRHFDPPANEEIFAAAVPSTLPIDGLETASPVHQAVLTAAHAWKHLPLRAVRDAVDVAVLAERCDPAELDDVARAWQMDRIWNTTIATARWLFADGRRPIATRLWAQSLVRPREATILERHVRRWVTSFWALPPGPAAVAAARNITADLRPVGAEGWSAKLRRSVLVATHPTRTRSSLAPEDDDGEF
jgi:hypothetical protein